jgi:hypothetical protein
MTSGGISSVNLNSAATYTLTCTNAPGSLGTGTAAIGIAVAPNVASFAATPGYVPSGQATTVTWNWAYANSPNPAPTCSIDNGIGAMTNGGTSVITLSAATTYSLICTNAPGSMGAETFVVGVMVTLASGQGYPNAIAVDSSSVYWTNETDPGTVMMLTPK